MVEETLVEISAVEYEALWRITSLVGDFIDAKAAGDEFRAGRDLTCLVATYRDLNLRGDLG